MEYWAYGIPQNKVGTSVRSTYHAVALSSLRSGVTYYYIVTSTDAAGNKMCIRDRDRTAVDPAILLAYIYLEEGNVQGATTQIDRTISATGDRYNPVAVSYTHLHRQCGHKW